VQHLVILWSVRSRSKYNWNSKTVKNLCWVFFFFKKIQRRICFCDIYVSVFLYDCGNHVLRK